MRAADGQSQEHSVQRREDQEKVSYVAHENYVAGMKYVAETKER